MKILLYLGLTLCSSVFAVGQTVPSNVPSSGLVAWYPFNGNANDESGNGNNGTITNASLTTDRYSTSSSAFYFDSTSYISGGCSNFPSRSRSISLWYLADTLGSSGYMQLLFGYGGGTTCGTSWLMSFENPDLFDQFGVSPLGKIEVQGHCQDFRSYTSYPSTWKDNWIHLVVTYDGDTLKYYFNGALDSKHVIGSITTSTSSKNWALGSSPKSDGTTIYGATDPEGQLFRGKLDDLAIWDRELTPGEILDLYACSGMTLYFRPSTYGLYNVSTNGGTNGTIRTLVQGGTPPYTYSWSGPSNAMGPNPTGLKAGSHFLEVTDNDGCKGNAGPWFLSEPGADD